MKQINCNLIVVGVVRNCEKTIISDYKKIKNSFSTFNNILFYLVESDSNDSTIEKLNIIKSLDKNFNYHSLGKLRDKIPNRSERIAFCRNNYVKYILDGYNQYFSPYILVSDFDGINNKLSKASAESCFLRDDWDVCSSNQAGPYFDIWALRHKVWCPEDCWANYAELIG